MSPRAAWRLESLGFTQVYDYAAGKKDWFDAGLPMEGEIADAVLWVTAPAGTCRAVGRTRPSAQWLRERAR